MNISQEKWYYLKKQSQQHNARFIRCDGTLYEVTTRTYATGPSPQWSIDEVFAVDVPDFVPDPHYYD